MSEYLISFPSAAMVVPGSNLETVGPDAQHAVIDEAKAAGVHVFGGGIDEAVPPRPTVGAARAIKLIRA